MASDERRLLCAKRLCAGRTLRRDSFPEELFGDYSWSMLMVAFIAEKEGEVCRPDKLYADANVAAAVGRRWAAFLVEQELLVLEPEVRLTASARDRLEAYLDHVIDIAGGQRPI